MARQRDEQKRELIIDTATRLFASKGFHATSIQDIVSETELSVGTIYLYFANKEEIFDALLETGLEGFSANLFKGIHGDMSIDEIAASFGDAILDAIYKNNQIVTILTSELSFQKKLQGFYSRLAESITAKYMDGGDEEQLYQTLRLSRKEFFSLVTIMISGLSNAMRIASASKGAIIRFEDIKTIMNEIILKSMLKRAVNI